MFRLLTRPELAGILFAIALCLSYALVPSAVDVAFETDLFVRLVPICLLAVACVLLGFFTPALDWLHSRHLPRVRIGQTTLLWAVWIPFVAFVLLVWVTAPRIPLVAALMGADAETIAMLREQFLKARTGWQGSFVYVNAIFCGAFIPYTIASMFLQRWRWRWLLVGFFLFYAISFVEKAFFLRAIFPLVYLTMQRRVRIAVHPALLIGGTTILLVGLTALAGAGRADTTSDDSFFSATFAPRGAAQYAVWRAFAIPMITAADGVRVFEDELGGRPLGGATSSLLAALLGRERIEFERMTFAAQWGQNETGTGSANAVYFIEAYVNFGYAGVVAFSLLIGVLFRLLARSGDEAYRAMWLLFAFGLYSSGLIGMLFSNGFVLLLFVLPLLSVVPGASSERVVRVSGTGLQQSSAHG